VASLYALLPEATFATFGDFTLRYSSLSHQYSCSRWRTEILHDAIIGYIRCV
jgi:hypothetical protein